MNKRKTKADIPAMIEERRKYLVACHVDDVLKDKLATSYGIHADVTKLLLLNITKYKKVQLTWTKMPDKHVWVQHYVDNFPKPAFALIDRMVENWLTIRALDKPLP